MEAIDQPPSVERLTRGVMKLLDRFSLPEDAGASAASGGSHAPPRSAAKKSNSYQEFILNLKALGEDSPELLRRIGEFIESINKTPVATSSENEEEEEIPGSGEEFAKEIREFTLNHAKELIRASPIWSASCKTAQQRMELCEHLHRVIFTKTYGRLFASTPQHKLRDEQTQEKISRLSRFIDPVTNLDLHPSLAASENGEEDGSKDEQLWQKAESHLAKMNASKTPHEKLGALQQACRTLYVLIKSKKQQPVPDVFIPALVYLILRCNPPNLYSNVEFIAAHKLQQDDVGSSSSTLETTAEMEQNFCHFASAVSFLRRCDAKALSMTKEQFDDIMAHPLASTTTKAAATAATTVPILPQHHFAFEHASLDDLKVSDLPKLLAEYKLLVRAIHSHNNNNDNLA